MKFESVKLGDLYEVHNGLSKGRQYFGEGYPFLSFSTVFNNWFLPESLQDLVRSDEKEQKSYSIHRGDVFITRTSETMDELGMSSVALKDYPKATYNGFVKRLRPIDNRVLPEYIGYYLRTPNFRSKFMSLTGSMISRASLRNESLLDMEVLLPSIEEQQKIASYLSVYDDLIENNQRQIRLLEDSSLLIYKESFKSLKEGEHRIVPFGDLAEVMYGKDHKKLASGTIPVIGSGGVMRYASRSIYSFESVLIPRKGTLNNIIYMMEHFWTIYRPDIGKYLYYFLRTLDMNSLNSGAAVPSMTTSILYSLEVPVPPELKLGKFNSQVTRIFECVANLRKQVHLLTEARNRLLSYIFTKLEDFFI